MIENQLKFVILKLIDYLFLEFVLGPAMKLMLGLE